MKIPNQSMPIGNQLNYNASTNGVGESESIPCKVCHKACDILPGPLKWACNKACDNTVCRLF